MWSTVLFFFCNHLLMSEQHLVYMFSSGLLVDSATLCTLPSRHNTATNLDKVLIKFKSIPL